MWRGAMSSLSDASHTGRRESLVRTLARWPGADSTERCWAIAIGGSKSSGSAASTRSSATRPPQEAPMTTSSYRISVHLAVELLLRVELRVAVLLAAEADRLLAAEREDAERLEALVEERLDAVLERLAEIDHHVAADDQVELVEGAVRDEVVLGEHDVVDQRAVEAGGVAVSAVVARELADPARAGGRSRGCAPIRQ